jgi:aminoglycoside phosphotransferase (APT) family kinase protein
MAYHIPTTGGRRVGFNGLDLKELGIPSESQYVAAYCRRTGREDIPNWDFFLAFSMFRLAAIVQGVYKRGIDGIASSATAKDYGEQVSYLADVAWRIARAKDRRRDSWAV